MGVGGVTDQEDRACAEPLGHAFLDTVGRRGHHFHHADVFGPRSAVNEQLLDVGRGGLGRARRRGDDPVLATGERGHQEHSVGGQEKRGVLLGDAVAPARVETYIGDGDQLPGCVAGEADAGGGPHAAVDAVAADEVTGRHGTQRAVGAGDRGRDTGEVGGVAEELVAPVDGAAQLVQTQQEVFLGGLLGHEQDVGVGRVEIVVTGAQQGAFAVVQAKTASAVADLDQPFGDPDPFEVLQRSRLHGGGFAAGLHLGVAVDQDVVDAELGQAGRQGQPGRARADDQHVCLGGKGRDGG